MRHSQGCGGGEDPGVGAPQYYPVPCNPPPEPSSPLPTPALLSPLSVLEQGDDRDERRSPKPANLRCHPLDPPQHPNRQVLGQGDSPTRCGDEGLGPSLHPGPAHHSMAAPCPGTRLHPQPITPAGIAVGGGKGLPQAPHLLPGGGCSRAPHLCSPPMPPTQAAPLPTAIPALQQIQPHHRRLSPAAVPAPSLPQPSLIAPAQALSSPAPAPPSLPSPSPITLSPNPITSIIAPTPSSPSPSPITPIIIITQPHHLCP